MEEIFVYIEGYREDVFLSMGEITKKKRNMDDCSIIYNRQDMETTEVPIDG